MNINNDLIHDTMTGIKSTIIGSYPMAKLMLVNIIFIITVSTCLNVINTLTVLPY